MEFYGGAADKVMGETIPYLDGYTVYTLREPHGVTGHIVPWNYPMQIIGRSVGAALGDGQRLRAETRRRGLPDRAGLRRLARRPGCPPAR
jgi:aldehyde dehydrogenase (NAD+)